MPAAPALPQNRQTEQQKKSTHRAAPPPRPGGAYGAALWRLPPGDGPAQRAAELKGHAGAVRATAWHAAAPDALASLDEGHLRTWRLGDGGAQVRRRRGSPGPVTPTTRLRSSLRSCAAARRAGRALIEVPARAL